MEFIVLSNEIMHRPCIQFVMWVAISEQGDPLSWIGGRESAVVIVGVDVVVYR